MAQARPVADNLRLLREAVASLSGLTEAARSQLLVKIDALRIALPTHLVREFPMELWLKVLDYLRHQPDDPVDHAQKALGDVAALALVCQPLYDALKEEVKKENALRGASFMPLLNPDESDRFLKLIRELKAEGSRIRPTATLLKAYSEGEARQIGSRELTFDMPAAVSNAVKHVGHNLEALYALLPADAQEGDALLARHFGIALMKCGVDALPNALVKRLLLDPEFFAEKIAVPSPVVGFAETTPFDGISMRTLYRGLRNVCTVATLDSLAEHDRELFARSIELVFRAGDVVLSGSRMDRATMGAAGLLLPLDDKREFLKDFARSVASGAHDDCPPAETLEVFSRLCADVGLGAISVRQKGRIASAMAGRIAALLKAPAGLAEVPQDWRAAVDTLKALRRGAILDDAQSPEFLATLHAIDAAIDQLPDAALRAEAAGHGSGPGAADAEPSHRYLDIQLPGALSGSVLAFQPDEDVRYGRLKDRAAALENPALCQTVFDHLRKPLVSDGADADELMRWARNGCAWLDSVHLLRPDQRKEMLEGLSQLNFFGNSYRSRAFVIRHANGPAKADQQPGSDADDVHAGGSGHKAPGGGPRAIPPFLWPAVGDRVGFRA